jgi:hypothetical protein
MNKNLVRQLVSERTPYEDAKAMLECFHEAGHAVVTHAVGWELEWAKAGRGIGRVRHEEVIIPDPSFAQNRKERERRLKLLRHALTVITAGPVSATIHQSAVDNAGYSNPRERRAYSHWWNLRVSWLFPHSLDNNPTSDYVRSVMTATKIADALAFDAVPMESPKSPNEQSIKKCYVKWNKALTKKTLQITTNEICKAEQRAERIIKKHWQAVEDISKSLHRSKLGHLSRNQLMKILNEHIKPQPNERS